ncbi:MAG: glycoside hydrolase family 88 protein [Bacteroidales bacterium]|nr:glycoside hydrolase family 88 protein [Bacteroidales bacterium]
MDALTERVFDTAKAQMILMDSRLGDHQMPRTLDEKGQFVPSDLNWWCSGFYPGSLWYVWKYTGDPLVRQLAEKNTLRLDGIKHVARDHDIGFQINCSFGNALRLTGEERWAEPVVTAANALAKRFTPATGVIRSWNSKGRNGDWRYPVIIDNMMNLELLMEGWRLSGVDSLKAIAMTHANTTMQHHFRPDYTTFHVVDYDPVTGAVRHQQTAQGYSDASAWARGQAWGLYGYTMMADKTGDASYLAQAHAIAAMLMSRLPADGVPYWDLDAPDIPNALRDASAGAIIASALVKLSQLTTDPGLAGSYLDQARLTVRTLASPEYLAPVGENGNFLLRHSVGSLPGNSEVDVPLSYADYYFLEALLRLKGMIQ